MKVRRETLWLAPILISTLLGSVARGASLAEVRKVYLFPMANGLDQYLAGGLTRSHVFAVVTDPKAADAVMTDRLGEPFEDRLRRARPDLTRRPPKKDKENDADKDAPPPMMEQSLERPMSTFHAGRGNVFLVDAKSQQVVWSIYQPVKHTAQRDVEHAAEKIVKKLALELNPPAKK